MMCTFVLSQSQSQDGEGKGAVMPRSLLQKFPNLQKTLQNVKKQQEMLLPHIMGRRSRKLWQYDGASFFSLTESIQHFIIDSGSRFSIHFCIYQKSIIFFLLYFVGQMKSKGSYKNKICHFKFPSDSIKTLHVLMQYLDRPLAQSMIFYNFREISSLYSNPTIPLVQES